MKHKAIEFETVGTVRKTGEVWLTDEAGEPWRIRADGQFYYPDKGVWKPVVIKERRARDERVD